MLITVALCTYLLEDNLIGAVKCLVLSQEAEMLGKK